MKNPFERLTKKGKDAILATAATFAMSGAMAAEKPQEKNQDKDVQKIENTVKTPTQEQGQDSTITANFEAEQRKMEIKKLEEKKHKLEEALQIVTDEMHAAQSDFSSSYERATDYLEMKNKHKMSGLEYKLNEIAMQMGQEKVAKYDITSEDAVNGLMGILLSGNGPLKEHVNQLNAMMQGQLGSVEMQATKKPGKFESDDMTIHKNLGTDPKIIVKKSLEIVKLRHQIKLITEELNNLISNETQVASN